MVVWLIVVNAIVNNNRTYAGVVNGLDLGSSGFASQVRILLCVNSD